MISRDLMRLLVEHSKRLTFWLVEHSKWSGSVKNEFMRDFKLTPGDFRREMPTATRNMSRWVGEGQSLKVLEKWFSIVTSRCLKPIISSERTGSFASPIFGEARGGGALIGRSELWDETR